MWKRLLASFFIGASLLVIGSVGYSVEMTNKTEIEQKADNVGLEINENKYKITNPEKTSYSTEDRVTFINGIAPAKSSIIIEIYGTTDLTKKNFNLDKLPSDEDYIEIFTETIQAGNMGFFQKQLDLVMGINKIIIDFDAEGEEPYEIIVYVYDKAPTLMDIISNIK